VQSKSFRTDFFKNQAHEEDAYLFLTQNKLHCNIFWGQKLANTCSFVGRRIIVQQEKNSRAEHSWTNPLNTLQEVIHYSFIKFCIYCFSLWYEFFVHYSLRVEKIINMVFKWDLWNLSFFGRGDVSPTHSELCHFVSGS
jgi:hypothetical protein